MRFLLLILGLASLASCNYNYYQGQRLEDMGRFEEANLEYRRAYTSSPFDEDFKSAYLRTSELTSEDLLVRYQQYISEGKMDLAFARLQQAKNLTPSHPLVTQELRKWTKVLVAGKVNFSFKSLKRLVPLADDMSLMIRINTANPQKILTGRIDNLTKTFSMEDVIYNVSQKDLIFYSINSIGVGLKKDGQSEIRFIRFVDLKIPYPKDVSGSLTSLGTELKPVDQVYPLPSLQSAASTTDWVGHRGLSYSLALSDKEIKVQSSNGKIDYLPQMLYINHEERRIFIDFGVVHCFQRKLGGAWTFKREIDPKREYLEQLKHNLALSPYFFYREGAYPFVPEPG